MAILGDIFHPGVTLMFEFSSCRAVPIRNAAASRATTKRRPAVSLKNGGVRDFRQTP